MKSTSKITYKDVKAAFTFANTLFNRTDRKYLKIERFTEFLQLAHTSVMPVVFAALVQWFMNMFSVSNTVPFTYVVYAAVGVLVFSTTMLYISSTVQNFREVFEEQVNYNMGRRKMKKLSNLRFPTLMNAENQDIIDNVSFDFYQLTRLATMRIELVRLIAGIGIGTGLSILLDPFILLVCLMIVFTRHKIKDHFWKMAEKCRDDLVEEQRKAKSYEAHTRDMQNFIQFSAWGFISYMNRNLTLIKRRVIRAHRAIYLAERRASLIWLPIMLIVVLSVVLWALHRASQGSQSILVLGMWYSAFKTSVSSLNGIFSFWRGVKRNTREFQRFQMFLNLPERATDKPALPTHPSYTIELCTVTFTYPNRTVPALKDVSLSITQGERVAFIGKNGCGKTTTFSMLCGFLDPTSGSVTVNGYDLSEISITTWHEVLCCVTQMSDVGMTIGEIISGNRVSSDTEPTIWRALDCVGLAEEVRALTHGIHSRVGEGWSDGTDFSTGQRQKLRLAVAVFKSLQGKVKVVVLDEPTANLDPQSKIAVIEMFASLGVTLIVSLHDYSLLPYFTRVIELDKGVVVSDVLRK